MINPNLVLCIFESIVLFVLACSILMLNQTKIDRLTIRVLNLMFTAIILIMVSASTMLLDGKVKYSFLKAVLNGFENSLAYVLVYVFGCYLELLISMKSAKKNWFLNSLLGLMVIGTCVAMLSIWNGMIFEIVDGYMVRGPFYYWNKIILMIAISLLVVRVCYFRKQLGQIQTLALLSYGVLFFGSILLQLFYQSIFFVYPAMTISLLLVYGLSYYEKQQRMESELAERRIDIMMSQIRPNFIYNSLTAIYNLCEKDPQQAQNAISDFSRYLRKNIDSIGNQELVPFKSELKHVETYTNLEKMRFNERLNIEYEIESDDFNVPALSIQPLVENAIKHGICMKVEGGTVKITSKELDQCYMITIEDNGIGFDQKKQPDDYKGHIGIENVRQRLCTMCNGKLKIKSRLGVGTIVIVSIPKGER